MAKLENRTTAATELSVHCAGRRSGAGVFCVAFGVLLSLGAAARAEAQLPANQAVANGRDSSQQALALLMKRAAQGDATAQENLGERYEFGAGVPQNYVRAVEFYRQAAAQHLALAEVHLGLLYERGVGVPRDYPQALGWYQKAASKENNIAEFLIGRMYEEGRGVPMDNSRATSWYERSAAHGNYQARGALARLTRGHQGASANWSPWVSAKDFPWLAFRSACKQEVKGSAAWLVQLQARGRGSYSVTAKRPHQDPLSARLYGGGGELLLHLTTKNCKKKPEVRATTSISDNAYSELVYKNGEVRDKFHDSSVPGFWGSLALGLAAGMAGAAQAEQNQASASSAPSSSPTGPNPGASYPSGQAQTASPGGGQLRNTCLSVFPKPIQSAAFPDIHAVVALHNHCNEALDVAAMTRNNSPGGGGGWCEGVSPAGEYVPPGGDISFDGCPHGWCAKANCADEPVVWNAMDAHYDSMNGTSPPYPKVPRSHKCGRVF